MELVNERCLGLGEGVNSVRRTARHSRHVIPYSVRWRSIRVCPLEWIEEYRLTWSEDESREERLDHRGENIIDGYNVSRGHCHSYSVKQVIIPCIQRKENWLNILPAPAAAPLEICLLHQWDSCKRIISFTVTHIIIIQMSSPSE